MSAVQIVVLGKSLGGAVALHLASSNPDSFKAIVVEKHLPLHRGCGAEGKFLQSAAHTHCSMLPQGFVYT